MVLSIEDPIAVELAEVVALMTGVSPAEAVVEALREKLQRLDSASGLSEALLEIGRDCARRLGPEVKGRILRIYS